MLPNWWKSDKPYIIGDCLKVMATMPDKCVDITFTSPPFKDEDVNGDYWVEYDKWMKEIFRITDKVVIIINSATRLNEIIRRYPPKRTMVWGKGIVQYAWRWNPIFVYQISEDYKVNKYIWSDCFGAEAINGGWKVHIYQDPEILYNCILSMFKGCKIAFDPFLGSATTIITAKENGMIGLGCEIDPMHEPTIVKRLETKRTVLDMFGGA
jgi:adenine-specific DNA-methyltransferase